MTATTIPTSSDETLVEKALSGDAEAFGEIVRSHQKKIYRVVLAIVRDELEADSITQDTFIQAHRHLPRFERRSNIETWLTRIAINRSRDVLRKRKRWTLTPFGNGNDEYRLPDPPDDRPDAQRLVESRQLREAISRGLANLSEQQRIVFQLRHLEGLPLEAIARMLGLKPGTVRAHLFRAVHKIREELAPWNASAEGGTE